MTIIAAFGINGCPIVFGDLLVTGPASAKGGKKVSVPAVGYVHEFFGASGWTVTGLHQKVTIISDNCVLAWAGSLIGARNAISELKTIAKRKTLTCEDVLRFLRNDPELARHPAGFVGILLEGKSIKQFKYQAEDFLSDSLGRVYLAGSGSHAVHEFSDLMNSVNFRTKGKVNLVAHAFGRALSLGGMLLQSELGGRESAATIMNMFGGGYEIASYYNGRVQKLDDVSYVIWDAELMDDEIRLSLPQLIVKQKYVSDFLLIRSMRTAGNDAGPVLRVIDDQRHIIRPMFDSRLELVPHDWANLSLESSLICHCIIVRQKGAVLGVYTRIQQTAPDSEKAMTFTDERDQVVLGLNTKVIKEIGASLDRFR